MARRRRRRARANPRNSKGRFVKRGAKRNPRRRARRVKRRVARANPAPVRRRRRRIARANPAPIRRRRRRVRRNPTGHRLIGPRTPKQQKTLRRRRRKAKAARASGKSKKRRSPAQRAATRALVARNRAKRSGGKRKRKSTALVRRSSKAVGRRRRRRFTRRSKGLAIVTRLRKRARRYKRRSLKRSVAMAQYHRASALRRVARRSGSRAAGKTALAKAMHIKTNPGFAGLIVAAKTLAPQAAVGGVALFGLAFGGKFIASKVVAHLPAAIQPYAPALGTLVATGVGYVVADKVAPKYKGAVAIGGLLGAIVQGVVAAASASPGSFLEKAKSALLGDYTTVGFGDYTTVGGRAYADGGMFREVGDYTTVGEGGDNATEFAHDSLRGLDDNTEFAPGEGGVLSGGLFRGSSR